MNADGMNNINFYRCMLVRISDNTQAWDKNSIPTQDVEKAIDTSASQTNNLMGIVSIKIITPFGYE